jgi:hypothetical protein
MPASEFDIISQRPYCFRRRRFELLTKNTKNRIRRAWGDSRKLVRVVTDIAAKSFVPRERLPYPYESQYLVTVGVLLGEAKDASVEDFISALESRLSDERCNP